MKCSKMFIVAAMALTGTFAFAEELAPVDAAAKPETAKTDSAADQRIAAEEAAKADLDINKPGADAAITDSAAAPEEPEKKKVTYKTSKLIPYVLITSNYEIPNLFAETVRKQLNIPYIMILDDAREPKANARIAFFAPKAKEPLFLKAKDLSKLLAYLRARDVIILGNSDYVPAFYALAVPKTSRTLTVADVDWQVNAYKLSNLLSTDKITKAYRAYLDKRAADLKKKRAEYEAAEKAKREAIENAGMKRKELMEAEGL